MARVKAEPVALHPREKLGPLLRHTRTRPLRWERQVQEAPKLDRRGTGLQARAELGPVPGGVDDSMRILAHPRKRSCEVLTTKVDTIIETSAPVFVDVD